jgi:hypothetical protein
MICKDKFKKGVFSMDKKCKVITALVVIFLCLYYADGINALVKNEKNH